VFENAMIRYGILRYNEAMLWEVALVKVIIADDEIYICSLIKHIVAWDKLGLQLLGVFTNGDAVLTQFVKEPADILICDIEMPGMSGTELIHQLSVQYPDCKSIVISGFRSFEYARQAMQYGVTHYLLKPIDGDELNTVLKSIIDNSQASPSTPHSISEQNIRLSLTDALLAGETTITLAHLNGKYHFHLRDGVFNIISAVFTGIDTHEDFLPKVMSMFSDILKQKLMDFCFDAEIFRTLSVSALIFINYERSNPKLIHSMLDAALRETLTELGGKTQCRCFLGVGIPVEAIDRLNVSLQTAESAVCCRLESQNRQIYYAGSGKNDMGPPHPLEISLQERQDFAGYIEAIYPAKIDDWTKALFTRCRREFEQNPQLAFSLCKQVVDLMLSVFDSLQVSVGNKEPFRKKAESRFCTCSSFEELRIMLATITQEEMTKRLAEKRQNMAVYAQQAINYIDKHYAEVITLELLADKLHISPVHLSVVFKRETGMNYSKYLAGVRVEKSKVFLKQPNMNLSQVADAVGYDSPTYFGNLFRKYTGLRPSEYRRLHQQDIGD
jgi:two-component system, response regulator YesN